MSKLMDYVQAQRTGNMYSPLEKMKYTDVEEGYGTYKTPVYMEEYRIEVRIGALARVEYGDKHLLAQRIERTKDMLTEEVFGEFRKPLMELEAAIYDRDFDKASKLVEGIYKTMFY